MSRTIQKSPRRAQEREIAELRAALLELTGAVAQVGDSDTLALPRRTADTSGVAKVFHREINAGALSIDDVPSPWSKEVQALIEADGKSQTKSKQTKKSAKK